MPAPKVDVAFEREVLDGLGRLLLDTDDHARAADALKGIAGRLAEVQAVAYKHKVTPIVAANLRSLGQYHDPQLASLAQELGGMLEPDDLAARRHRDLLREEVLRISQIIGDRGCVIKGFCNARFYPVGYSRWMRDVDVLCLTWQDALDLLEQLLAIGYAFDRDECSWIKADMGNGRDLYGQIFLIKAVQDDFSRVDVHFGTYSVGYAGYLDSTLLTSVEVDTDAGRLRVLEPEACILVAQSHALSDGYVAIKDVNDFVAISTAVDTNIDWYETGRRLREHDLQPQAALLARHVLRLYSNQVVRSSATRLLKGLEASRATIWQTHNRSWRLRAAVNTSFAYRWRRRNGPPASALLDALRCFLFYSRRLDLSVRSRSRRERLLRSLMASPDLSLWKLRPDACTLLIDLDVARELHIHRSTSPTGTARKTISPTPGVEVVEVGGYHFVRLQGRVFVPTLDLIVPPEQVSAADE